jgi:hypothetical protein
MGTAFDTLRFARRLREAGFSEVRAAHERRHVWQAWQIKGDPRFPGHG